MDYEDRLLDKLDAMSLGFPVYPDVNASVSSISVAALPGSTTVRTYYDDVVDKEYIHEIKIKARETERQLAVAALMKAGQELDKTTDIESEDDSFDFGGITVTNELFFSEATTEGWMFFTLQIKSLLTVWEKEEEENGEPEDPDETEEPGEPVENNGG